MPRDLEGPIHKSIVAYLRQVLPADNIVHHSANEGVRGGKRGLLDGARKKAMGQVAGFPDIMVLRYAPLPPVFFEVKAPRGAVSEAQERVHDCLRSLGCPVAVVRSVPDVRETLREWSIPTKEVTA